MIQTARLICILLLIAACSTPKSQVDKSGNTPPSTDCTTLVTAKDFTGLDGCQMLLVTEAGKKLLVAESIKGKKIEAGKSYKIGYEIAHGIASVCMAENEMIMLRCLEEVTAPRPELSDCWVEEDAFKIPFLKHIIETRQPQRIIKHAFRDGAAYRIDLKGQTLLYDCQGNNMCEELGKSFAECFNYFNSDFGKSKIIYQGEGPQD